VSEWQPISTAPKDGSKILGYWPPIGPFGSYMAVFSWDAPTGYCAGWTKGVSPTFGDDPSHWMLLPPAPEQSA
jgi:hypothetical protein